MATTGTSVFDLDMNSLVEEAFERCGVELRTGYDLRTATRSLNLLTVEWANRGINLWTVEEGQIPMNTGQSTYPLPVDTIDLLSQVIRTGTLQNQMTSILVVFPKILIQRCPINWLLAALSRYGLTANLVT